MRRATLIFTSIAACLAAAALADDAKSDADYIKAASLRGAASGRQGRGRGSDGR